MTSKKDNPQTTRRQFIGHGSKLAVAGAAASTLATPSLSIARSAHAFGSDTIRIGLIGCGGRGTGAAAHAMNTRSGNVELVSMADAFENRLRDSLRSSKKGKHKDQVKVNEDAMHVGFDAYKRVLESDCELVILATPPGFRPLHFEAAIEAGKHVFMGETSGCGRTWRATRP